MEEVAEFTRKKEKSTSSTEMACWILEVISSEAIAPVEQGLYSRTTLQILRKYLEVMPPANKIWMVHLISSLLNNLKTLPLSSECIPEVIKLVGALRELTVEQYKKEEQLTEDRKSSLLQALLQATVLGEASPVISSEYVPAIESVATGFSETKEEVDLLEEKQDEELPEVMVALLWSTTYASRAIVLRKSNYLACLTSDTQSYHTILTAHGGCAGVASWCIRLVSYDPEAPVRIGVACKNADLNQALGSNPHSISWSDGKLYTQDGLEVPYGPKLQQGDNISVIVDFEKLTVRFLRNKANVGLAFGPVGSGAAAIFPNSLIGVALHGAVSLIGKSEVRLVPNTGLIGDDALLRNQGLESTACFLEKVKDTVDYLKAFVDRKIPGGVVKKEILPLLREKNKVSISVTYGTPLKSGMKH